MPPRRKSTPNKSFISGDDSKTNCLQRSLPGWQPVPEEPWRLNQSTSHWDTVVAASRQSAALLTACQRYSDETPLQNRQRFLYPIVLWFDLAQCFHMGLSDVDLSIPGGTAGKP